MTTQARELAGLIDNSGNVTAGGNLMLSFDSIRTTAHRGIRPTTTNTYTLGSSGLRWSAVYATTYLVMVLI